MASSAPKESAVGERALPGGARSIVHYGKDQALWSTIGPAVAAAPGVGVPGRRLFRHGAGVGIVEHVGEILVAQFRQAAVAIAGVHLAQGLAHALDALVHGVHMVEHGLDGARYRVRSEEHTSELQSRPHL